MSHGKPPAGDLQADVDRRSRWFFECQLRGLNIESFRGNRSDFYKTDGKPLDTLQEWSNDENAQRGKFDSEFIGNNSEWLGYRKPRELLQKLSDFKESILNGDANADKVAPRRPRDVPNSDEHDQVEWAVARLEVTNAQPWLFPDLYGWPIGDFLAFDENELRDLYTIPSDVTPAAFKPRTRSLRKNIKVSFLGDDNVAYQVRMALPGVRNDKVEPSSDPRWAKASYWLQALALPIRECFTDKEDSDMGLSHLIRVLYLYGTIPDHIAPEQIRWRTRSFDERAQQAFAEAMQRKKRDEELARAHGEEVTVDTAADFGKLEQALQLNANNVGTCDFRFSLIVEEVIKQCLLAYKYWLDEPFHCLNNDALNNFKNHYKVGPDDYSGLVDAELQFWSENHYIQFAAAEYLVGQLWPTEDFLAGRNFLSQADADNLFRTAKLTGAQREERGKWRVLKYLNNRLRFGWTEFNASGYYREHFWPLANLVDFALDEEVRRKAELVLDLLFFDLARFGHKGSFGVVGGRSQFKSKQGGWQTAIGDVIELAFGTRGAFADRNSAVGMFFATSHYKLPRVLLEIGTNPPQTPFVDRSRVSISFDDAAKHGITYPDKNRQRDSQEAGYAPKLSKHAPYIARVRDGLAKTHMNYGAYEDDVVFWWTTSAFFAKQVIAGTQTMAKRWGLDKTKPFDALSTLFGDPANVPFDLGVAWAGGIAGSQAGMALGSMVGAAPIGGALGAAAGAAGAALELGKPFANLESFSAWAKVALYGLSPILGPIGVPAAVAGLGNPFSTSQFADDLSILIEGSIRSRLNLYTYRDRDVMLSSVQVFRPGQMNVQSNLCMATLSTPVSVFPTTPFKGLELPDVFAGIAGGLVGGIGGSFALGAIAGVIGNELWLKKKDLSGFVDHVDGLGWFTGYWASPMIVQHQTAAVLLCDFHWFQRTFADYASHVFVPESGFDEVAPSVEPNRDKYDDAEGVVEDVIGSVSDTFTGKHGTWWFGRIQHEQDPDQPEHVQEAYIGVFSYQILDVLDQSFGLYRDALDAAQEDYKSLPDKINDALDDLEHQREVGYVGRQLIDADVKKLVGKGDNEQQVRDGFMHPTGQPHDEPPAMVRKYIDKIVDLAKLYIQQRDDPWRNGPLKDYFSGKDQYATGKNIFIIQLGSSSEFGSFDEFRRQVVDSTIKLEPHGDMKCTYEGPYQGGRRTLKVHYADGGHVWVDGNDLNVDSYPRWESTFVRGGKVEWLQPEYTFEYNGQTLTHRPFLDGSDARVENISFGDDALDKVIAFAMYVRTENENLDVFSVGLADVVVGCATVASDEVIAVGEISEDTQHDVEWIEFETPVTLAPDMTIELKHPAVTHHHNPDPHWRMSFTMRALMGDHTWRDCIVAVSQSPIAEVTGSTLVADYGATQVHENTLQLNFEGDNRSSGALSFLVKLDRWRVWHKVSLPDAKRIFVARVNPSAGRYDHSTLFGLNIHQRLVITSFSHCADPIWERAGLDHVFAADTVFTCIEPWPGYVLGFVVFDQQLHVLRKVDARAWVGQPWQVIDVKVKPAFPPGQAARAVLLANNSPVLAITGLSVTDHVWLILLGSDGRLYGKDWQPGPSFDNDDSWRELRADGDMAMSTSIFYTECGGALFVIDDKGGAWAGRLEALLSSAFLPAWTRISPDPKVFTLRPDAQIVGASVDTVLTKLFVVSDQGEIWTADFVDPSAPLQWELLADLAPDRNAVLSCVSPMLHQLHLFVQHADGSLVTKRWSRADGWKPAESLGAGAAPGLAPAAGIWPVSRGQGLLEVLALGSDQTLVWSWWS